MKARFHLLSVLLNLALASGLLWSLYVRRTPGPKPQEPVNNAERPSAARAPRPASPVAGSPTKPKFHWSQVESSDYLAYIANLRSIDCPEETIRDIILADVNKLFGPRYAALAGTAPELAWWGWFDRKRPLRPELTARLRALNDEKKAILQRLLGTSALTGAEFVEVNATDVREQNTLAFLSEPKQTAVSDLVDRYRALREWGEVEWKKLSSDDHDAKVKELHDARTRELATLLTPEELREFELRDSSISDALREEYGKADLSEAEFRKLYELRRDFEERIPESNREDWKRLTSEYASALGKERFTDLQRQNDSMWRAMQSMAEQQGLTPEAMAQAYAIKEDYAGRLVEAVGNMFADPARDPKQLRDIAAEMDDRLAATLGPSAAKQLERSDALPRLIIRDDGKRKLYSLTPGAFEE